MNPVPAGAGASAVSEAPPGFALALADRVVAACDPIAVLLFGSWAKGRADRHSDVDLIVVLDCRASPPLRAELEDVVHAVPMHVDVLVWTMDDIEAAHADPHGFAGSALGAALPLHRRAQCADRILPARCARSTLDPTERT